MPVQALQGQYTSIGHYDLPSLCKTKHNVDPGLTRKCVAGGTHIQKHKPRGSPCVNLARTWWANPNFSKAWATQYGATGLARTSFLMSREA